MDQPIIACIQHRVFLPKTTEEYDAHLHRFLRMAKAKGAVLALFPELSGVATAFPLLTGWRNTLLKEADQGRRKKAGFWQRMRAKLAGSAATVVKADLRTSFLRALHEMPESLYDAYYSGFSNLAQQYEMTIVAGSLYQLDPDDGVMRNISLVFGPDGSLLGRQAKVVLSERDQQVSQAADGWGVIPTPAGRIGILLGHDVLYPEPARILAYQGADMLLTMGAVTKPATFYKIRSAALARCQENQLYGMVSFLVGPDPFAPVGAPPFVGKSAIFAPLEFTHRFTGVMVEVGSPLAEGVITAEWDYPALEELWQESDTPLRREMPLLQAGPILAQVYGRALPLAEAGAFMLESPEEEEPAETLEQPEPAEEVVNAESPPEETPLHEPEVLEDITVSVVEPEEVEAEEEEESAGLDIGLPEDVHFPPLMPIIPESIYAPSPEEIEAAVEDLAEQLHLQSQNMAMATDEVREDIQRASERVRVAAGEVPHQVDETIHAAVEEAVSGLAKEVAPTDISWEDAPAEASEEDAEASGTPGESEPSPDDEDVEPPAEFVAGSLSGGEEAEEGQGEGATVAEALAAPESFGQDVEEMETPAAELEPAEDEADAEAQDDSQEAETTPPDHFRWPWQRE